MPSGATLIAFSVAAFILVIIPGPAVFYILGRGMTQGRRAAVVSALGIETGSLIHVIAAVVGLSAIISASALAYESLRWAGVVYLLYLGIDALRSAPAHRRAASLPAEGSATRIYLQGVLVNVLNPKVTLFFLAFLPQFVEPGSSQTAQILVLGIAFLVIATVSDLTYAVFSGLIGERILRRPALARFQRYIAAAIYLVMAALGALNGGRRTAT